MPRHHVVPRMYLRRFADDAGKLAAVPRDRLDRQVPMTVRTAAASVGFYAIPAKDLVPEARDGHDPEVAEKALAGIEATCAGPIERLVAGECPPRDLTTRLHLSVYIALQHNRGWRFRRDLADLARLTAPEFLRQNVTPERVRAALAATGRDADPASVQETLAHLTGPDGPRPVLRQAEYVQHAIRNAVEVVGPTLFERRWRLLRFDRPCLLTSDEPLAVPVVARKGAANVAALWLPLDRRHALQLSLTGTESVVQAPLSVARKINSIVASQSEKWVFHHPVDRPLEGLEVRPRLGLAKTTDDLVVNDRAVGHRTRVARTPLD